MWEKTSVSIFLEQPLLALNLNRLRRFCQVKTYG
jgi:hypothetical protein